MLRNRRTYELNWWEMVKLGIFTGDIAFDIRQRQKQHDIKNLPFENFTRPLWLKPGEVTDPHV
jgi:hypothetical protein